mgnify:FL=1
MKETDSKQYFFRFRCPTRLAFGNWLEHQETKPKGVSFDYKGDRANVVVFDEILATEPAKTHFGIGIDVLIEGDEIEKSQKIVEGIILEIISILAFAEACFIGLPEFVLRYALPQDGACLKEATAYVLDKNYRPIETTTRIINRERVKGLFSLINSITINSRRNAIRDSLHWFWRALDNKYIRDRFLQIWIAIEYLEKELKAIYKLNNSEIHYPRCEFCKEEFKVCPKCEKDFGYKANPGFTGYKTLEKEAGLDGLFNELHRIRSKLVHGGEAIIESHVLEKAILDSHSLLVKAFFVLCGADHKESTTLPMEMRSKSLPMILY